MKIKVLCFAIIALLFNACEDKKGILRISTEPAEASIFIDGEFKGLSSAPKMRYFSIKLKEGKHTIKATKQTKEDGYKGKISSQKMVYIGADTMQTISMSLDDFVIDEDEKERKKADDEKKQVAKAEFLSQREKSKKLIYISDTYRSNKARLRDFIPQGDGTVLDRKTALQWMRCNLGQSWNGLTCTGKAAKYTWEEARNTCISYAGKNDWRLPSLWELETLIYCSSGQHKVRDKHGTLGACKGRYESPTLVKKAFPNTHLASWTSTVYASLPSGAWNVHFNKGVEFWYYKYGTYSVRCVR